MGASVMDESFVQQLGRGHVRATGGHADDSQQSDVSGLSVSTARKAALHARADLARMMKAAGVDDGASALSLPQGASALATDISFLNGDSGQSKEGGGSTRRRARLKRALEEEKGWLERVDARAEGEEVRRQGMLKRSAKELTADLVGAVDGGLGIKEAELEALRKQQGGFGLGNGALGNGALGNGALESSADLGAWASEDRYVREVEAMKRFTSETRPLQQHNDPRAREEEEASQCSSSKCSSSKRSPYLQDVTIEMIADPACPWGYVSRKRILSLVEQCKASNPEILIRFKWRPFVSITDVPLGGQRLEQFITDQGMEKDCFQNLPGLESGTAFKEWLFWPNSLHAQRLLLLLGKRGGPKLVELALDLMHALTFEEGANISTFKVLAALAAELGVADPVVFLRSKELRSEVVAQHHTACNELNIEAAPFFRVFISDRPDWEVRTFAGAKEEQDFLQAVDGVLADERRMFMLSEKDVAGEKDPEEGKPFLQKVVESSEQSSTSVDDVEVSYGPLYFTNGGRGNLKEAKEKHGDSEDEW